MQISLEVTSPVSRKMRVEVPWDDIASQEGNEFQKLARQAKVPGFRPGKVPMRVLKQQFADHVRLDVIESTIRKTFIDALEKEAIHLVGMPHFDSQKPQEGQPFGYTATFEVYPEVNLVPLTGIKLTKTTADVTEADIEQVLQDLRAKRSKWHTVERPAQLKDNVTIDFAGFLDGEAIEGGVATDHDLVLGSKVMVPGFEDQLVGATLGETRTITVTFPSDYRETKLAGKAVNFTVTIKKITEPQLPDIDAEFAKGFGIADGSIEALRTELKAGMQRELNTVLANLLRQQVIDKLVELNPIEVPKTLVQEEIRRLKDDAVKRFERTYGHKNVPHQDDSVFMKKAQERVIVGLLLREVVEKFAIKPDADKVRKIIETRVSAYEQSAQLIEYFYSDESLLTEIENEALEEQVIEKLMEDASVDEKVSTYFAVMRPNEEAST